MPPTSNTPALEGLQISGNPNPEEVAAIVAALMVVKSRSQSKTKTTTLRWGRPALRGALPTSWSAPSLRSW